MFSCTLQSIMKNYDQNQDGYISMQEFEEIAANFPFSFCIRKTDRCISRSINRGLRTRQRTVEMSNIGFTKSLEWLIFVSCLLTFSCTGTDKSVVRKSPLTSSGECRYVPSWATTSMMRITFMKPHINDLHFAIPVEALWVIVLF